MASEKACIFVTGTDTGVGKTLISSALLLAYRRHYRRVVGMKPVAAGLEQRNGQWVSDDVLALASASSISVMLPPTLMGSGLVVGTTSK